MRYQYSPRFYYECGKTTCATPEKKMCRFARTLNFSMKWTCVLFHAPLWDSEDGWLERCKECLEKGQAIQEPLTAEEKKEIDFTESRDLAELRGSSTEE